MTIEYPKVLNFAIEYDKHVVLVMLILSSLLAHELYVLVPEQLDVRLLKGREVLHYGLSLQ
jgi:hypothetical protein